MSFFLLLSWACTKQKVEPKLSDINKVTSCDTSKITFSGKINPIFVANCYGCHDQYDSQFAMQPFSTLKLSISNNKSKFLNSINHNPGASKMPKNGNKLSDCDLKAIATWIDAGMPQD